MSGLLRLDAADVTLLVAVDPVSGPLLLHWGRRLPDDADLTDALPITARATAHHSLDDAPHDAAMLPTPGRGLFGHPALAGSRDGRDRTALLAGWRIESNGLRAFDEVAGLKVTLELELADSGVLATRSHLRNLGAGTFALDWLASSCLTLPAGCDELLVFSGRWGGEWPTGREALGSGTWLRENRRGRTSHDSFPALILGEPGFGPERGPVWGFHLGWSGNHRLIVEPTDDGRRRVQLGELLHPGEVRLGAGESLTTAWAYASFSEDGIDALTRVHHHHVRRHVLRWPGGAMTPRPVTLNTWEANYFEQDEPRLRRQAEAAARLGVERFVVDDGWFKGRNDDRAALGDWVADPVKFPHGLAPLARHVETLGMQFGLWVEPEMVNPDSDLFRAHPDWALHIEGRPPITARSQLVLDVACPEVADHLFAALHAVLDSAPIGYLKWDMNRDLVVTGETPSHREQTLAFWVLVDRLREAHPAVEIEACASGGRRADWGVLTRTHRIWTSDVTDALERQRIQRGFSLFFPPEVMGAHASTSPNHQTGRRHTVAFRCITALFGHFGLELDPLALSDEDAADIGSWIGVHRRLRPLLHGGRPFRHPPHDGRHVHGVISDDRRHAVIAVVQESAAACRQPAPLLINDLDPTLIYRLSMPGAQRPAFHRPAAVHEAMLRGELRAGGAVLSAIGLTLPELAPETALLIELTAE